MHGKHLNWHDPRVTPSFPDAWYWIGRCLEISGQKEEAKLNYEKAYSLDKTFTEAKEAAWENWNSWD